MVRLPSPTHLCNYIHNIEQLASTDMMVQCTSQGTLIDKTTMEGAQEMYQRSPKTTTCTCTHCRTMPTLAYSCDPGTVLSTHTHTHTHFIQLYTPENKNTQPIMTIYGKKLQQEVVCVTQEKVVLARCI